MKLKNWKIKLLELLEMVSYEKDFRTKLEEHFKDFGNALLDELEMEEIRGKNVIERILEPPYMRGKNEGIKETNSKIKSLRKILK